MDSLTPRSFDNRASSDAGPSASEVVSEALCRNNWSGFGAVCAGVCEACTIPSQPHACEHALTVWGSDAQNILNALAKAEGR